LSVEGWVEQLHSVARCGTIHYSLNDTVLGLAYLHDYNSAERLDMSMTGNFVMKNATSPF
jgi:hypothetical protein